MQNHTSRRRGRAGFTLVELMVVVGIIIILISILLPVVASVQRKARATDTSAEIDRLATACQNYFNDFRNYPGPAADSQLSGFGITGGGGIKPQPLTIAGGVLTSSENLVLGLLGGLTNTGTSTAPMIQFVPALVGRGPQSLNPLTPKQTNAYVDLKPSELTQMDPTGASYVTYNSIAIQKPSPSDTQVPEFLDHFQTPMPIIYLRARVGAKYVVDDVLPTGQTGPADPQYFSKEMLPYYVAGSTGPFPSPPERDDPTTKLYTTPFDFFRHPTINDGRTPRGKDTFILISAGMDGLFGTKDDVIFAN